MPHWASLLISLAALAVYLYCFHHSYVRPDGRGRLYLLIVFGCLSVYWLLRVVGHAGLQWHFLSGLQVNELFRWAGYVLIVPGVWIAAWAWKR